MTPWGSTHNPPDELIQVVLFSKKEQIFKTQINNRMIGILFFVTTTVCFMVILDKRGLGTSNLVKQWEGGTDWAPSPTLGFVAHSSKEAEAQKIVSNKKWGARGGRLLWLLWIKCIQGREAIINSLRYMKVETRIKFYLNLEEVEERKIQRKEKGKEDTTF